jgi:ABC-type uncharacterized transport system fused permease/ATPase subunit
MYGVRIGAKNPPICAPAFRMLEAPPTCSPFRAGHTVGLGDIPRLDDEAAVVAAVERAGAGDVIARLTSGLDTQLGPTWPAGVELSFGQWQKLALARGFMRDGPLLLVLDEPTAALDAETEHALFELSLQEISIAVQIHRGKARSNNVTCARTC